MLFGRVPRDVLRFQKLPDTSTPGDADSHLSRQLRANASMRRTIPTRIRRCRFRAIVEEPFNRFAGLWQTRLVLPDNLKDRKRGEVKNIFVGNLDFAATDSSVRAMFEPYGSVDRVNLVTDRDTGRSRGFAFVEMSNAEEADRAIAGLNGMNVDGRALNVNEARPKPQGSGGGRGGNGGGGFNRQRREPRW